jgi:hypothetical protein
MIREHNHLTFLQAIEEVALNYRHLDVTPTYDDLDDTEKEMLTAAYMRDNPKEMSMLITDANTYEGEHGATALAQQLLTVLDERNIANKNFLLMRLARLAEANAIEFCRNPVEEALEKAFPFVKAVNCENYIDDDFREWRAAHAL